MAKVLTLVECDAGSGTARRSACALLTVARRLGEPVAVVGGAALTEEMIRTLGRYGATEIWSQAHPERPDRETIAVPADAGTIAVPANTGPFAAPADAGPIAVPANARPIAGPANTGPIPEHAPPRSIRYTSAPAPVTDTDLLTALARRISPAAILIPASPHGQETAARLAIRLDSGIITDAVDVRPGPAGEPVAVQHCLAGSYFVESSVVRGVPIITVGPEAAVPEPSPVEPILHTIAAEPGATRAPRIAAVPRPRTPHPALDHADIVVAGGRGVGSRAAFAVLAEVADALGAAVAGSHTAAELGWIPPEARVGLTGKTVHPRLYIACGVSGSVRHRAGMQGAKTVVAIGDDPAAPIFKLADLGVVGDAQAILPALLAEIRSRTQLRARTRDPDSEDGS